jgi:NTE family protein
MKIGLALSGGGIRGISHLGVIKALEEHRIPIAHISGTSSGAITGVFYAAGYSPDEILELIIKSKVTRLLRPAISKLGFLKIDLLKKLFDEHLPVKNFEELKIPVTISATLLKDAQTHYFSSGPISSPLLAASCVPILFKPVDVNGNFYIDGGIVNNLPVEPLLHCDRIIGSLTNPIDENFVPRSLRTMIERTLLIAVNTNTYSRREKCDYLLEPEGLKTMRVFSFSKTREIFRIGYEYTLSRIDEIKEMIDSDVMK